jgi:molybdate transport repressor ModE-like protein
VQMDVNLEYYKLFYCVVKCGSITQAADKLHISQPAVSQGIKNLEKALGSPVFVRAGKGIRLTTEGEMLYRYVQPAYEEILMGERKFKQMKNLETGEIRIGASDMTLRYYILPYLELFHERFPNIKISVTNAPTPETLRYMQSGSIDFGVVSTPFQLQESYEQKKVKKIRDVFVVGEKYKEYAQRILTYKELKELPYLCLEGQTSTKKFIETFLKEQEVSLQPELELATSDMLVTFVEKGFGVANIMEDFIREGEEKGKLFRLNFSTQLPSREICIIYERKYPLSAAAKMMLEIMGYET